MTLQGPHQVAMQSRIIIEGSATALSKSALLRKGNVSARLSRRWSGEEGGGTHGMVERWTTYLVRLCTPLSVPVAILYAVVWKVFL